MNIHIRSGSANDLPELIELQNLALRTLCAIDYDAKQINSLVESQNIGERIANEFFLIAQVDDKMVGFGSLSPTTSSIHAMYVHPDWIRQGIGKKLLASLEEIAAQRSCRVLRVISSLSAAAFYQSQGYRSQGNCDYRNRTDISIPCQLFEKQLFRSDLSTTRLKRTSLVLALMLLGISLGLSMFDLKTQTIEPQLNVPSAHIEAS